MRVTPQLSSRLQRPLRRISADGTSSSVDDLKHGIIKTSKDKAKPPYTVLLVGETGVGKSSALELIANVLTGKGIDHFDFEILHHTNEDSSLDSHPQTNSARLYEVTSNNGIVVSTDVFGRIEYV